MRNSKNDPALQTIKSGINIFKNIVEKLSDNLKTIKENQYVKKLEKRSEIEQYTLVKLPHAQAIKYKSVLDTIDHNFDILENSASVMHEKAVARGKIKALRKIRDEIESSYLPKSKFSRQNNKRHSNDSKKQTRDNQESDNSLGDLSKIFEPYNENHHR